MPIFRYFVVVMTLALGMTYCTNSTAQTYQVNSPYSSLGIGNILSTQVSANRGMGGVSLADRSLLNINYTNPASYSAIQLATIEFGIEASGLWLSNSDSTHRSGTAALSYLSLAFPVAEYWGLSFGLLPYSSNNYDILTQVNDDAVGRINYRFVGSGQLYQAYLGNGFKYKNIALGFNIGYLFGTLENDIRTILLDVQNVDNNVRSESIVAGNFLWNVGAQYTIKLKNKSFIILGLSGHSKIDANVERDVIWNRRRLNDAGDFTSGFVDSVRTIVKEKSSFTIPTNIGLGIIFGQGAGWLLGADVTFKQWDNFSYFGETDDRFSNSIKFAIGGSFIPEANTRSSFWKRMEYRFGFNFDTGNLEIQGQKINRIAVTTGIGIPIKRVNSRINLSLEAGRRGNLNNGLIRENFVNAVFGITLNDRWFIKRKFD